MGFLGFALGRATLRHLFLLSGPTGVRSEQDERERERECGSGPWVGYVDVDVNLALPGIHQCYTVYCTT